LKKFLVAPQLLILFVFASLLPQSRADFVLTATASPTRVTLGNTVTYNIAVSNTLTSVQAVQVSSVFPVTAQIISANNGFTSGRFTTNSGQVVFTVDLLPNNVSAAFSLQLQPAESGDFQNLITVQTLAGDVPQVSTNIVVTVGAAQVDLGLSITGLPPKVVIGDQFNYTINVTNAGPSSASDVRVLSVFPTNLTFVSVNPAASSTFDHIQKVLTLTTSLTNTESKSFVVTALAQTNGDFNLATSVVATQNSDTATNNNTLVVPLKVLPLNSTNVAILSVSPIVFNYQTALFDQIVVVTNLSTNTISEVRVIATNLVSPNELFNATGTNSGHPYVMLPTPLGPTNTAAVTLQFWVTNRTVIDVGFLAVEGPSLVTLKTPTGTFIPISTIKTFRTKSGSGAATIYNTSVFIEFPTVAGRKYSLVAAPTVDSTNRVAIYPPLVANSGFGQFVDTGPQVTGDGDRFYSVIEQP
jgi:uncharacterized repeat protein (TIGR01451 family)